jgi:hypothetical protein
MAGLRDFADAAGDSFDRWASNRAVSRGVSATEGTMPPEEFERTFGRPAATAPQAPMPAVGTPTNASRLYAPARGLASGLARMAPAALGATAVSDFGANKIADPDVDSSAGGTMNYLRQGDWSGAGASLKKGALETGMDLMSGVAKVVPGHSIEDLLGGMRNALGNQLTVDGHAQGGAAPVAAPGAPASTAPNPTDSRMANGEQGLPEGGVSVPDAPGVRKFTDARGGTGYSNVPGENAPSGAGVSVLPFSEGLARQARANEITKSTIEPGSVVIPGVNAPATQYERDTAARNAGVRSTLGAGAGLSRPALRARELDLEQARNGIAERGQDLTAAAAKDSTAAMREGHQLNFDSSIYGTDMGGKNARARLNYEMGKDNRDYGLRNAEFGAAQDKTRFEQRAAGDKALHEQITNLLPPTVVDGKQAPDTATAARYASGLQQVMGARRHVLEQRAAQGDTQAAADMRKLDRGELPADEMARAVAGMKAADLARQYHTGALTPWGGTGYSGDQPIEKLVKESRLNGDVYNGFVTDPKTGKQTKVAEIPARAVEKTNADFIGGQHRIDLNSLIQSR